jgi:DNA polymerase-3 subunit delta
MRIDSEQLDKHLARGMQPLYTVLGAEPLLALEAGDRLRERARELGCEERTLLVVESGFDWKRLGEAAASLSLFTQKRLIELRVPTGKPGVAGAEAIERHCRELAPDTVTLVHLPALDWKSTQAGWFQALEGAGPVIESRPVLRERLPQWLAARMARNGQRADAATLAFIADRVEGNLLAAWQEVQKLALLLPQGELAAETVRRAVLDVARFDAEDLCAALLAGDRAHFVRVVDGLQAEGAGLPLLLGMLTYDLRGAYKVGTALARGQAPANALREAQVFGPRRNLMEPAARRWTAPQLRAALAHAARIDRIVKGLEPGAAWDELRLLGIALSADAPPRAPASRARGAV